MPYDMSGRSDTDSPGRGLQRFQNGRLILFVFFAAAFMASQIGLAVLLPTPCAPELF